MTSLHAFENRMRISVRLAVALSATAGKDMVSEVQLGNLNAAMDVYNSHVICSRDYHHGHHALCKILYLRFTDQFLNLKVQKAIRYRCKS